uniref:Putative mediator of rna polymerase ii transcription subunit 12-like protein n=1 Tax=Amblyomma aureolatum TaxID=187763 RepID=A0A1E1X5B4_9ACAR
MRWCGTLLVALALSWRSSAQMQQQHQQMHQQIGMHPQQGAGVPQMQVPQMQVPMQQQQQVGYGQPQQPQQFGMPQQGFAPQQQQPGMVPQQQPGMVPQQMGVAPQQQQLGAAPQVAPGGSFIREKAHVQDRAHIQEHLSEMLGPNQDMSKMSEEELQFHYFKLHDNDDNNKLDGLELIKSLIHWHVEESKHIAQQGQQQPTPHGTTKLFTDQELLSMIDPILQMDDRNKDGFIDYPEFVAAQKSRGF